MEHLRPDPPEPLTLAVVVASTREGRFGPRVAGWFSTLAAEHGAFAVDVVDLAAAGLPMHLAGGTDTAVERFGARLDAADAFAVVTPEYNHGYPAALKQAIDLTSRPWQAKPVGFVAYGGMSGGLRAVEQLRQVYAEMHAVTVRDVVSLHNPWSWFDDTGALGANGAEAGAKLLLERLAWWADALRRARRTVPYAA